MEEIKNVRTGAFSPWSRNPVLHALVLPFGGVGALALIDTLVQMGL